jgi:hypothetical protein
MLMNNEKTKQYQKAYQTIYYAENKEKLIKTACTKYTCLLCNRTVNKNSMKRHQSSSICRRNRDIGITAIPASLDEDSKE